MGHRLHNISVVLAGAGLALLAVTGCVKLGSNVPAKAELPYNAELTNKFSDLLDVRGLDYREPRLLSVYLFCEKTPGPIKVKVVLDVPGNEMKPAYTSNSPCSEAGELVSAVYESSGPFSLRRSGYYVRSRQAYDADLVVGEWQKAFDAALGTFTYNQLASETISSAFGKPLSDLRVQQVNFICESASKKVSYRAHYQGDWRTGTTTVGCPEAADKSEFLATLSVVRNVSSDHSADTFRVSTVKAIDSMAATKLVGDFLQSGGRRASF